MNSKLPIKKNNILKSNQQYIKLNCKVLKKNTIMTSVKQIKSYKKLKKIYLFSNRN